MTILSGNLNLGRLIHQQYKKQTSIIAARGRKRAVPGMSVCLSKAGLGYQIIWREFTRADAD